MEYKNEDVLEETKCGRSRRSGEKKDGASNLTYVGIAAAALILTLGAGIGFYFAKSGAYQETFMPNTTINEIDVSGMSIEEVKAVVEAELAGYELKIIDRTGAGESIAKDEIGLRTEYNGGLEQILAMQEPMTWIKSLWTEVDYQIETMLVYDEELLADTIRGLSFMDKETMEKPVDAYLSDYQFDTNSYEIIAQTEGTELMEETVIRTISQAVLNLQKEVDLDAAGCYTEAAIQEDDPELVALAEELNRYAGVTVTHQFGEIEEVLDGDTIHEWLTVDGNTVTFDESQVTEYVKALAKKYNTAYEKRPFLTTYGDVVTIPGGSYGWRMNQTKEVEAILDAINTGAVRTREPEWLQEGASHGEYDYGDTYVEINLTGQHLFFYKDGKLLVECDFVSGNASRGWSTPAGAFPLTYKERNATLRGENYATPVSYWMPFNGNIGLHDADWRASFGGAIYKTNGSHGCINLPPKAAQIIYETITKGDPVICYQLEGTDTKLTSKASEINTSGVASVAKAGDGAATTGPGTAGTGNETVAKPAETTAVPETKPVETKPAVPETAPAVPETSPAVPETSPAVPETSPAMPETAPTVQETKPVGQAPGETAENGVVQPEAGAALTETRPAGVGPGQGPGYSGQTAVGPGYSGSTPVQPSAAEPVGPGYQTEGSQIPIGPGYSG